MELVEKIMELNYHAIHADQWRRITLTSDDDVVEVAVDGFVTLSYESNYWDNEGADVITGERWVGAKSYKDPINDRFDSEWYRPCC